MRSFQPSRAMALPVYQQDKYPFLHQHNDAPILGTEMLEEWFEEYKSQHKKSSKFKYPKRRDNDFGSPLPLGINR